MKKASTRKRAKAEPTSARRSPCPVACCLDIVGDRWTLLVIRDLMLGRSRFKDFTASPESIPTNILTERLQRLLKHELAVQVAAEGSKHLGYELTKKGKSLLPILKAMKEWGLAWEPGTKAALTPN